MHRFAGDEFGAFSARLVRINARFATALAIVGVLIVPILVSADTSGAPGSAPIEGCGAAGAAVEIADGVYVRQGQHAAPFAAPNVANIGFIVGDNCVAVIDSGTTVAESEAIQCAIQSVTQNPVCYLVLTHHHYDHAMGSRTFKLTDKDTHQIIAHAKFSSALQQSAEYYRNELATDGTPLPADTIVLPDQVINAGDSLQVDLGGRILTIVAYPPAHTDNDLSVMDDKTKTLWLSDLLFLEHTPAIDSSLGSINGWLQVLDDLQALPAMRAVPGHGPISVDWPTGVTDTKRYLSTVRDEIRQLLVNNGSLKTAEQTVGQSEADKWQLFDIHHGRNVIRAFTELEWE